MTMRGKKGFTLIEVIVVAGIIAILAGILVPLIFKEIDESKISRASADIRSISNAVMVLKKDTGQWPVSTTCTPTATLITGLGTVPALAEGWSNAESINFYDFLNADDLGCWPSSWKGPYMATVNADPWGKAYVVNADAFLSTANPLPAIWIISAGPNGIVDTPAYATVPSNDDVGVRLR